MNIAIIGAGKMGTEVAKIAEKKGHKVTGILTSAHIREDKLALLRQANVAIEFTRPEAAHENITLCLEAGVPVVSGTTGWLHDLDKAISYCSAVGGAFLHASNFSVGVHIFFEINRRLASIMSKVPSYEVSLYETHHTAKLDMPSGTAIVLANDIISMQGQKTSWSLNPKGKADAEVLPVFADRKENVPGTHKVVYASDADEIVCIHEAKSRTGFAEGAIMAAEWIDNRQGFFTMRDVLNDLLFQSHESA